MLQRLLDPFRGKAVTIPPMDGPLRPNNALDEARAVAEVAEPDNLILAGGRVLFSSGGALLSLTLPLEGRSRPAESVQVGSNSTPDRHPRASRARPEEPEPRGAFLGSRVKPENDSAFETQRERTETPAELARFDAAIAALAAASDGSLAVALDDGRILLRGGAHDGKIIAAVGADALACPTAVAFADPDTLLVCQGSTRVRPSEWVVDLMSRSRAGSVWRIDLASGAETMLAGDLAFPSGIALLPGARVAVADSWRHRLLAFPATGGKPKVLLDKLPGYPSRLAPAADGGFWLSLFAPRNRLIEFILQEEDYRSEMIRDVDRSHWIAPALSARRSFLEPLQCGGVRTMGVFKPWSPTMSYGLLVKLDAGLQPVASFHSRAAGVRHGITSALGHGGELFATSRGGDAVLALPASGTGS